MPINRSICRTSLSRKLLLAGLAAALATAAQDRPALAQASAPQDLVAKMLKQAHSTPTFEAPPAGVTALSTDLFTSKNFYRNRALWSDQRYWRCNTPRQISDMWTSGRIGKAAPASAAWGDCRQGIDRASIVSPYPYKTAKAHYEALLARARAHGGPTVRTKATVPDWDGYYSMDASPGHDRGAEWTWGINAQTPTILSLLTPEHQKRMVQLAYHESVSNDPQWEASFCYPEGLARWWTQFSEGTSFQLTVTPWNVQMLSGIADNFIRQVMIGQKPVLKGPQWFGETVGFWDGDTLTTWTSNVRAWTISHSMFEVSDRFETVETYRPAYDASHKFIGLDEEAIFYDPNVFVQPVRVSFRFIRNATPEKTDLRYGYIECKTNLRNVAGRPVQLTRADPRYVDYYGRPWAQVWNDHYEAGWTKPDAAAAPQDVLDLFK